MAELSLEKKVQFTEAGLSLAYLANESYNCAIEADTKIFRMMVDKYIFDVSVDDQTFDDLEQVYFEYMDDFDEYSEDADRMIDSEALHVIFGSEIVKTEVVQDSSAVAYNANRNEEEFFSKNNNEDLEGLNILSELREYILGPKNQKAVALNFRVRHIIDQQPVSQDILERLQLSNVPNSYDIDLAIQFVHDAAGTRSIIELIDPYEELDLDDDETLCELELIASHYEVEIFNFDTNE